MGVSTVFGESTNDTKIDSKTFVQIIDWVVKTGKPRPIIGSMAKQIGLSSDDRDVDAIQKAYGNATIQLAIHIPSKNDQMDLVIVWQDAPSNPSKEVAWKLSRAGVLRQTYTIDKVDKENVATAIDNVKYAQDLEKYEMFFAKKMNDWAKTNNVANGNLQPPANK